MCTHPTAPGASQSQVASFTLEDVIDSKSNGVSKHLGEIADSMSEWEGAAAENLGLTPADISHIKTKFPKEIDLQALVTTSSHVTFIFLQILLQEGSTTEMEAEAG